MDGGADPPHARLGRTWKSLPSRSPGKPFAPYGDVMTCRLRPAAPTTRRRWQPAAQRAAQPVDDFPPAHSRPAAEVRDDGAARVLLASFVPVDVAAGWSSWRRTPRRAVPTCGRQGVHATGQQGVTYKPDTWHHGLTVLDRPGRFRRLHVRAGTADEEFVLSRPSPSASPDPVIEIRDWRSTEAHCWLRARAAPRRPWSRRTAPPRSTARAISRRCRTGRARNSPTSRSGWSSTAATRRAMRSPACAPASN